MGWSVVNTAQAARNAGGYHQVAPSVRAGFHQVRPPVRPPGAGYRQVRQTARPSRWHVVNTVRQPRAPVVIPNYHLDPSAINGLPGGTDMSGADALIAQIIAAANPRLAHAQQVANLPRDSGPVTPAQTFGGLPPGTDMSGIDELLRNILAAASVKRTAGYPV
jgi:hypothetical protein